MKDFVFCLPTSIVFGLGELAITGAPVNHLEEKTALISEKQLAELSLVARVRKYLKEKRIKTLGFANVTPGLICSIRRVLSETRRRSLLSCNVQRQ
jgi:alcohol dehydrogenase class IV